MYIPLNVKTNYSLLTSLVDINKLIKKCKDIGYKAIGICDTNMYGVMEFYEACISNDIKPIIGLEIEIDEKKVLIYAKNYIGYQNLCYIFSNEKNIDNLQNNSKDLFCILPYNSVSLEDKLSFFEDIYFGYKNKDERNNLGNKRCIYLNEIRCIDKDEKDYLKYAYMIKDGKKIRDDISYEFDLNNYLEDIEELKTQVNKIDLINYKIIYNDVNTIIKTKDNLLPKYNYDGNFNDFNYLLNLCKKGLMKRLDNKVPVNYAKRLMYELDIIKKMGFANYFLVVWDFVKYSKQNGILVGPGRGSAVGSLVSYSLGITDIDPLKYDLLFERFLNPERITMPDIDVDFDSSKRDLVIKYVTSKYGEKKVSQIITFSTLKSKQVLRDVLRIFDYDGASSDRFIKLFDSKLSLEENKKNKSISDELKKDTLLSSVYDICIHLEGLKRQTSIHAAGVIISSKDLDRYIPAVKNQNGDLIAGFTMNYLEKLGLLKMDFLSIDNLTLVDKLLNEIGNLRLSDIKLDDKETLELFRCANTEGIFQFESAGMRNVLRKFNVTSFEDLVALIALYRPGPMQNIDSYVKRKEGLEKIDYIHENIKPILESTYGIIIYQEQIMQIANVMAGYSLGEADVLRRAMGKKSHEIMENEREKFISRSVNRNYSKEISEKVFDLIYKFADFGFNKSHSVGYATLAFKMAYIKAHYPNYFISHLLSSVIGNDIKTKNYIDEAKTMNQKILLPSINESTNEYSAKNGSIRFPLSSVHNVGVSISREILKERENGPFKDFFDFMKRCFKKINRRALEYLIYSGSFKEFGYNKKTLIENIDIAINYANLANDLDESLISRPEFDVCDEYTKDELIEIEYNTFGFYLSYHPVQKYRKGGITTKNIKENFNKIISIYLLIDRINEIKTKKGDKMAFVTASDEFSSCDLVIFPKSYEVNYNINRRDVVLVTGKVEKRENDYQIIVNKIIKQSS